MSDDEWDYVRGTWNQFENSHGWRVVLSTENMPSRWPVGRKKEYAAALLWALNHGQPSAGDKLNVAGEP
jgi:hypothetical protein